MNIKELSLFDEDDEESKRTIFQNQIKPIKREGKSIPRKKKKKATVPANLNVD